MSFWHHCGYICQKHWVVQWCQTHRAVQWCNKHRVLQWWQALACHELCPVMNSVMNSVLSRTLSCHELCPVMNSVMNSVPSWTLSWTLSCHELCPVMNYVPSWTLSRHELCHELCPVMNSVPSWTMSRHELWPVMNSGLSWTLSRHELCPVMNSVMNSVLSWTLARHELWLVMNSVMNSGPSWTLGCHELEPGRAADNAKTAVVVNMRTEWGRRSPWSLSGTVTPFCNMLFRQGMTTGLGPVKAGGGEGVICLVRPTGGARVTHCLDKNGTPGGHVGPHTPAPRPSLSDTTLCPTRLFVRHDFLSDTRQPLAPSLSDTTFCPTVVWSLWIWSVTLSVWLLCDNCESDPLHSLSDCYMIIMNLIRHSFCVTVMW